MVTDGSSVQVTPARVIRSPDDRRKEFIRSPDNYINGFIRSPDNHQ